ncbi:uncharacterized protein BDR25DRAFT_307484 [Lindgomyces ingoldianus]|uniref:Uncharacterized protein n=1 Tax=Lindgomyces ingoldianus TaxID=673940 RepID=A0ACB6QBR3_9PLEO|nr:uncharacterized protein BDR25DRAFT_307484 [Lindgomyces ingoldianus]KAF2463945.1 hypothetical protein BDR25DRAFT_307484 [Lindgomyces ingoldianus]
MGWLWSSGERSSAKDTLDPSLREFLDAEAPTGPKPPLPSKLSPTTPKPAESLNPDHRTSSQLSTSTVPSQSQFKDGRYADLWKNYTPQSVINERGKNEQDKLRDIVDAYNERKSDIGRVALENCAFEYMAQYECFRSPSWYQTATLCNAESRRFNRCYDLQTKFLKALGYLTMDSRSAEDSERIQMHADKLYQQFREQEQLIEKAKEEGMPIPRFESVLSKDNVARAVAGKPLSNSLASEEQATIESESDIWSHIKKESREEYEKKMAKMSPEDQEIEKRALLGELEAQTGMASKVGKVFVEESINRMKRREAGQATIGDTIKHLWGWK